MVSIQDECCPTVCEKAREVVKLAKDLMKNSPALHDIAKDLDKKGEDLANLANLCGNNGSVVGMKNLSKLDEPKVEISSMTSLVHKGAALATSAKSKVLRFSDFVSCHLPTTISCEFITGILGGVIVGYATAHVFIPNKQEGSCKSTITTSRLPDPKTSWTSQVIPSTCRSDEYNEVAWGIEEYGGQNPKHVPMLIPRPKVTDFTVKYEILFSGICHGDCSTGTNDWFYCCYPCVPGHEHAGIVTEVGSKVTKVKVGDKIGVGFFIDACLDCKMCRRGEENYCEKGIVMTFNGTKSHGRVAGNQKLKTFGGYAASNVVHEHFVMKIPDAIPFEKAAPLLCAGITLYDPLRHWGATKGHKIVVGVVGVGGLGTMGIKLAKALGHTVVAVSRSKDKKKMAREKGADYYIATSDPKSIGNCPVKCDLILNTIGAKHDINVFLPLLAQDGTIVQLGLNVYPQNVDEFSLAMKRQKIAGSIIGGIKATEECLELCAIHSIYPDVKLIEAKDIDWAWQELIGSSGNKDGVRYVIDIKKSLKNQAFIPSDKQI